jgi:hypothetical protein
VWLTCHENFCVITFGVFMNSDMCFITLNYAMRSKPMYSENSLTIAIGFIDCLVEGKACLFWFYVANWRISFHKSIYSLQSRSFIFIPGFEIFSMRQMPCMFIC